MSALPPEARLLLAVGRDEIPVGLMDEVTGDEGAVRKLLWLARRERALLPVSRALLPVSRALLPVSRALTDGLDPSSDGPLEARLRGMRHIAEFQARRLAGQLETVLALLAEREIPAVLLKGAALATAVYPSFADRPMADLDLLVPADRAARARKVLEEAGWSAEGSAELDPFYRDHHHLRPLEAPDGTGIVVELHRSLLPPEAPFRLAAAEVWRDSTRVRVGRVEARVPSLSHLALHSCLHFAWSGLLTAAGWRTFRDLKALRRAGLRWESLHEHAASAGTESCCFWTLRLAEATGFLRVPPAVLAALRPPGLPAFLERLLVRHFLAAAYIDPRAVGPSVRLGRLAWSAALRPRRSGYGRTRPWRAADRFEEAKGPGRAAHGSWWAAVSRALAHPGDRLRRQVAARRLWAGYLRGVGGRSRSARSAGGAGARSSPSEGRRQQPQAEEVGHEPERRHREKLVMQA